MICPMVALLLVAFAGLAQGRVWEAVADGIPELEEVEKALQKVSSAKLGPKQQAAAQHAVADVEQVLADLQSNHKLTKAQKATKVKASIRELQSLQAQWQLAAVEASLKKVVADPHLTPQQLATAKKIVADIDTALDEVEAGKLDTDARNKKVAFAIQQLQDLQQELSKGGVPAKEAELEQKIAEKKLQLKKAETELKLADLQKQLLEKKMQMQKLVAAKKESEEEDKQRQEGVAEQEQVSKLLAAARSLAAVRKASLAQGKNATVATSSAAAAATRKHEPPSPTMVKNAGPSKQQVASGPDMKAIVSDLQAKLKKDTESLAKFDADFNQRMVELKKSILASKKAANSKKGNMVARSAQVLEMSLKRQTRLHLKARALRVSEINDLRSGIRSVEQGDVAALSVLLGKMEKESKSMQAVGQNFLH